MTDARPADAAPLGPPRNRPPAAAQPWWDVWDQFKTHKGALFGDVVFDLRHPGGAVRPADLAVDPHVPTGAALPQPARHRPIYGLCNQGQGQLGASAGHRQLGRDMLAR
jgi:peptide/nickel transport system permease protein